MVPSLLIMVREGFEAGLIVALVFAYLRKIGRLDMARATWLGVLAAAAVSIAVGVTLHVTVGGLVGAARMRAFAAISLVAACVLTWMVFWMRRQSRAIKGELEHKVDVALSAEKSMTALSLVAFLAVLREGIEAALFIVAAATDSEAGEVVLGAVVGLVIAAAMALAVYAGSRRIPMRSFFQVTGMIVIIFAAGLLARTVLFLQSAGDLGTFNNAVYNLTGVAWLTQSTEVGKFLAAMFGWDPRPSIEQVLAWSLYIVPVTWLFLRGGREARQAMAAPPSATATATGSPSASTPEPAGASS
jgi:high-affinity iron transporter